MRRITCIYGLIILGGQVDHGALRSKLTQSMTSLPTHCKHLL